MFHSTGMLHFSHALIERRRIPSRFTLARRAQIKTFDDRALRTLSKCHYPSAYARFLDDEKVEATCRFRAQWDPRCDEITNAMYLDGCGRWHELEDCRLPSRSARRILDAKADFRENLRCLEERLRARKRFWLERFVAETQHARHVIPPALRPLGSGATKRKARKCGPRYQVIDEFLREVAKSCPATQREIFQLLDNRKVSLPPCEPFMSAKGWMKGFDQNEGLARAWLSKRWPRLDLPPLPRGPKQKKQLQ
jgi:hypothetical protein